MTAPAGAGRGGRLAGNDAGPRLFVIGGSVAHCGEMLFAPARRTVRDSVTKLR
ncbi:MAG: hypothetical protein ACK4SA_14170 [Caldilinea sp.]